MLICSHQHLRSPKWADKEKHPVNVNVQSGQVQFFPLMCVYSSSPPHCQRLLLNLSQVDDLKRLDVNSKQQDFHKLQPNSNLLYFLMYSQVLPLTGPNLNSAACLLSMLWVRKWLGTPYSFSKQPCWGCCLCVCSSIVGGKHHITVTLTADI